MVGGFRVALTVLILFLAGCRSSPPPDARNPFREALDALSRQLAVAYRVSPDVAVSVTRNGLAQGSLNLAGQRVRFVRAGDSLYLLAPPDYWQARGMAADRAGEYAARWVRAGAGATPFDPGRLLAPAVVARTLWAGLPPDARPSRNALPDGTEILDANGLRVTAAPPYRVVSVAPALFGAAVAESFGAGPVVVDGLSGDGLSGLRSGLDRAISGLGRPFVAGPVVTTTVTANDLGCGTDGSCTDTVTVEHRVDGDARDVEVRLVLTASVSSADLGTRTCEQETVVAVNQPARLACPVSFQLPRRTGSTVVVARPTVTAEPVAIVDVNGLQRAVAAELGG